MASCHKRSPLFSFFTFDSKAKASKDRGSRKEGVVPVLRSFSGAWGVVHGYCLSRISKQKAQWQIVEFAMIRQHGTGWGALGGHRAAGIQGGASYSS